ncbi:MAG TPA: Asp-tRNA(Asn)/Glu-tRNA(Gln) amidotransferase subunit GatB [Candidatus Saccharimonadales bacterium]
MADKTSLNMYQPTIGMECHVQLNTKTKLFARVDNDARGAEPNTTVSAICFGLPGVLPFLNQAAVDLAIRAGLALNAQVNTFSKFDRKHYFYPDLPKGYQITQYEQPIIGKGFVDVPIDGKLVKIGIERAHLEEDAGKLTHPGSADYSLVDLNRAGTPLLEIVSQPDIKSPAIAKAYARELYLLMKYAGVSDVDLYHGHMRFDVNISVAKKDSSELGTRAEVKNLNSFKAVEKAAQYEFERQVELLEKGEKIVQETRGWHDDKQKTFSQRGKEEAHDYRYFPEPDLPPIEIEDKTIKRVQDYVVVLPKSIRNELASVGVNKEQIENLLDMGVLLEMLLKLISDDVIQEQRRTHGDKAINTLLVKCANWLAIDVRGLINSGQELHPSFAEVHLRELFGQMVTGHGLSSSAAKTVLLEAAKTGEKIEDIINRLKLHQVSGESEIKALVEQVITDNPKATQDFKAGESKALGFLTGQVMKASKGRANPKVVKDILKKQLEN